MTDRVAALQALAKAQGLDGLLVYSDLNRNYASRFSGTSGALLLTPRGPLFLTDSRYTLQAGRQVRHAKVLLQTRNLLVEAVERFKAAKAHKIGFEAGHVTVAHYEYLKKAYPKAQWIPTRGLVEGLRLVKDPDERQRMRSAGRITDRAIHHILAYIKPGVREDELAAELEHKMRREGAEGTSFDSIVASGWRSALPHGIASDKRVEKGDFIVFDFGCKFQGYCSDMTRTVCVGRPSALQKKIYGIVQRSQAAGLAVVRPGRTTGDVDAAARNLIKKSGYGKRFGHGTGHGVGVEVHEDPRVGPKAKDVLRPGMAITVEPGIYLDGKFGVRIEDLVLVTDAGYENMYKTTKDLIIV
jgi:Xaa-Pro aminopeptidase